MPLCAASQKREHLDSFKVDYRARGSGVLSQVGLRLFRETVGGEGTFVDMLILLCLDLILSLYGGEVLVLLRRVRDVSFLFQTDTQTHIPEGSSKAAVRKACSQKRRRGKRRSIGSRASGPSSLMELFKYSSSTAI